MKTIDNFLTSVENAMTKNRPPSKEFWPLKPVQMTAYFEDSLAVNFYQKIKILQEKNINPSSVAKYFDSPCLLRNAMLNFFCVGLKVANNTGWFKTSFKEREEFFDYIFEILKSMVKNDIFSSDKKQIILDDKDLKKIKWGSFLEPNTDNSKIIKKFNAALFGLVWSIYFDSFYDVGMNNHGPYKCHEKFGSSSCLAITDYFNMRPDKIWPETKVIPFEKIRIYKIYSDLDWKINFFGREDPSLDLSNHLTHILIEIDGVIIEDLEKIQKITSILFEVIQKQTSYVNKLSDLQKVKKAAEISYFAFSRFFKYFDEPANPPKELYDLIDKLGVSLLEEFSQDAPELKSGGLKDKLDPRNNNY